MNDTINEPGQNSFNISRKDHKELKALLLRIQSPKLTSEQAEQLVNMAKEHIAEYLSRGNMRTFKEPDQDILSRLKSKCDQFFNQLIQTLTTPTERWLNASASRHKFSPHLFECSIEELKEFIILPNRQALVPPDEPEILDSNEQFNDAIKSLYGLPYEVWKLGRICDYAIEMCRDAAQPGRPADKFRAELIIDLITDFVKITYASPPPSKNSNYHTFVCKVAKIAKQEVKDCSKLLKYYVSYQGRLLNAYADYLTAHEKPE